jgi:hypothetical protein
MADSTTKQGLRRVTAELRAARTISRKLQQLLWRDMRHFQLSGFEFSVAYVLFLRAERTFSSIRTLARLRMVDDAYALVRTMVEKIINAEYIIMSGTDTALDYVQYGSFRAWRDLEELNSLAPEISPKHSIEFLRDLKRMHDDAKTKTHPDGSQRSRFGRGHDWTELGLSKRAEFIDKMLEIKFSMKSARVTRMFYQKTYKESAIYLHGMWESIARSLEFRSSEDAEHRDGKIQAEVGIRIKDTNPVVAADAVNNANLAAVSLILFVGRVFGKKEYLDWVDGFRGPYIEQMRRARASRESPQP